MKHHQDDKLFQEMRQSLNALDDLFPADTPDLAYFETIVQDTKEKAKKRLRFELLAFWSVAIVVFSILYFAQKQALMVYLILQGLSLLAFVLILARKWVRNHDTTT